MFDCIFVSLKFMFMKKIVFLISVVMIIVSTSCNQKSPKPASEEEIVYTGIDSDKRLSKYVKVKLSTDISVLTENEKKMLPFLFEAAKIMDDIYWLQSFGDQASFTSKIKDENTRQFAEINYGPYDRLDNMFPFIQGFPEMPKGANFYPPDMTVEEFENLKDETKNSEFTLIKRNDKNELIVVPYHVEYESYLKKASELILKAAEYADDAGLKKYLQLRAKALLNDQYYESDIAWLEMKNNTIDFVVGPIEHYDDGLFEKKTAYESFILVKDKIWSSKLAQFNKYLPELQLSLPVMPAYKSEKPGVDGDLNAYDAIFYAGDCNSGSKTIAINLPNDPKVQLLKGTRRLQLKNSMRAKYDNILVPIANVMLDESQRNLISFEAFFTNTMFHEVAHGLGIKYLIKNKNIEVKTALKDHYSAIEEAKADILGLYMVDYLYNKGELQEVDIQSYYTTFIASIFRSIRFGSSSAHGKANMMRFNFFLSEGALIRNENGTYKINFDKMKIAISKLSAKIIVIQGDGDYQKAADWVNSEAIIKDRLQQDMLKLTEMNIPVDIVFEQGLSVLGL